jgi:hypothetical protein
MTGREEMQPNPGDKRYVRRDEEGRFTDDQVDESRSLARDNDQIARGRNPGGRATAGTARRKE